MNLLGTLVVTEGQEKVDEILERQMEQKLKNCFKGTEEKCLGSKLTMLVEFLNEEGYMVEVERRRPVTFLKSTIARWDRLHRNTINFDRMSFDCLGVSSTLPLNVSATWFQEIRVVVMLSRRWMLCSDLFAGCIYPSYPESFEDLVRPIC